MTAFAFILGVVPLVRALLPADDPDALDRTLESGALADVTLVADELPPDDPSVVYLDASTGEIIFGVPLA